MTDPSPRHSVSVAAAVIDSAGRVLAIRRRDNDHWEPPGGVLELGETIEDGLRREVREETGLIIEPGPLTGVYKNMRKGIVALVFRCAQIEGVPGASVEAAEVRWLHPSDVGQLMAEAYAVRLLDAFEHGPPAIRTHDGTRLMTPR